MKTKTTAERITPHPACLVQLPTRDVRTPDRGVSESARDYARDMGIDFRLELKLARPDRHYWLCTQGRQPQPGERMTHGFLPSWTVGYVTEELQVPNGPCALEDLLTTRVYGPNHVGYLQALDYCQAIEVDLARLEEENERSFTHERARQIDTLVRELKEVNEQISRLPSPWQDRRG